MNRVAKKPGFFTQGLLIVLPVLVLAGVGFYSLRQDQVLARHEATLLAQGLANDLSERIWTDLTLPRPPDSPDEFKFQVDSAGRLIFPPPFDPVPRPALFDEGQLTAEQLRLWTREREAEWAGTDFPAATQACDAFIESQPPDNFAAAARYAGGVLLSKSGNFQSATERFESVVEQYPSIVGESGLSFKLLAQLRLLEMDPRDLVSSSLKTPVSWDSFYSNAVSYPTVLTPRLLDHATSAPATAQSHAQAHWRQVWNRHEWLRELQEASGTNLISRNGQSLSQPRCFWFETPDAITVNPELSDRRWLGIEIDDGASRWISCRPEVQIGTKITELVRGIIQLPEYFGVEVTLAGKPPAMYRPELGLWREGHRNNPRTGGLDFREPVDGTAEVLATGERPAGGVGQVRVNVRLTSPAALFKHQRTRNFYFGSFITLATVVALVGLINAWRAFSREQRLSEMKSNFVSSVSHELRAPIASVRLMAEGLERGKVVEPEKQRDYFRFIVQECRRLSSLVENVLDFARIEQGRKEYEFESADAVALARETVKLMEPYAAEKGVRLELMAVEKTPPGQFEIEMDGRAIQQALVNLIDNALKHSPPGSTVTVKLSVSPETVASTFPSGALRLTVEDSGPGIPKAEQERIFERFYRRGTELRRETQGVGIGLSIVKHIVEAHHGTVTVNSSPGAGTRFYLDLPLAQPKRPS